MRRTSLFRACPGEIATRARTHRFLLPCAAMLLHAKNGDHVEDGQCATIPAMPPTIGMMHQSCRGWFVCSGIAAVESPLRNGNGRKLPKNHISNPFWSDTREQWWNRRHAASNGTATAINCQKTIYQTRLEWYTGWYMAMRARLKQHSIIHTQ